MISDGPSLKTEVIQLCELFKHSKCIQNIERFYFNRTTISFFTSYEMNAVM